MIVPQNKITLPSVACSPGAVARSVLMGLFGVNHVLRGRFSQFAVGLLAPTHPMMLPSELRLRVALASGTTARLTGAIRTSLVLPPTSNGKIRKLLSDAAVYFPPLAWQLVGPDSELLDDHGWGDSSDWLLTPPDRADVRGLLPSLPPVRPLNHDPEFADRLVHMLSDELAPIVECDGLMLL